MIRTRFPQSVKQYETGIRLQRRQTRTILSSHLDRLSSVTGPCTSLQTLHQSHILPDVESSSLAISRSLLPVMRKLKWSLQKDRLAKILRDHTWIGTGAAAAAGRVSGLAGFGEWLDTKGK